LPFYVFFSLLSFFFSPFFSFLVFSRPSFFNLIFPGTSRELVELLARHVLKNSCLIF